MVTDEDNATIERMIEEGKTAIAIRAAVPDVSRTNVYLKIAKFKRHGTVGRVQTRTLGRPRVMGEGVDKFLQGLLAAKPDMELEEMRRHMQDQLRLTVSMSTISRAISRSGIASGRPNRARNASRRQNKVAAAAAAAAAAVANETVVEDHSLSAQPQANDEDSANVVAPGTEVIWDQMQQTSSFRLAHHDIEHQSQASRHAQQQPQNTPMQVPSHHGQQHQELHALDPSLAQPFPLPSAYSSIYAELPRGRVHVGTGISPVLPPNMDVYRSPYAPL